MKYQQSLLEKHEKLKEKASWDDVQELAFEYFQTRVTTGQGNEFSNRSKRQKAIVNEIIDSTMPYIIRIAKELMYGRFDRSTQEYAGIPIKVGINYIMVGEHGNYIDDLVQDGAMNVFEKFHKYEPSKARISTWLGMYSASGMAVGVYKRGGFVIALPVNLYPKVKKLIRNTDNINEFLEAIARMRFKEGRVGYVGYRSARLIYASLAGDYKEISGLVSNQKSAIHVMGSLTEENPPPLSPFDEVAAKEIHAILNAELGTLTEREKEVLERRFGLNGNHKSTLKEIGQLFGVSRERIRTIEAEGLRRLKHPKRKKLQSLGKTWLYEN